MPVRPLSLAYEPSRFRAHQLRTGKAVYDKFAAPVINDVGDVAFTAEISGIPNVNRPVDALLVENARNLRVVTRCWNAFARGRRCHPGTLSTPFGRDG